MFWAVLFFIILGVAIAIITTIYALEPGTYTEFEKRPFKDYVMVFGLCMCMILIFSGVLVLTRVLLDYL